MEPSPLIHIGYHKTASTWMQIELFRSKEFHFISDRNFGPSSFAEQFFWDEKQQLVNSFTFDPQKVKRNYESFWRASKNKELKIPVISHERLSGNPQSSGFDNYEIMNRLHQVFPGAKIVIMIRKQTDHILSNYIQFLHLGGTTSLKRYLISKYDGKIPFFSEKYFDFYPLVKAYMQLFGEKKVLVLPYEEFKSSPTGFHEKLSLFLGKEIIPDTGKLNRQRNKRSNYFLKYYLKFLGPFLRSSSVNNYSYMYHPRFSGMLQLLLNKVNLIVPERYNVRLYEKLKNRIELTIGDLYKEPNKKLDELIESDLEQYGYF